MHSSGEPALQVLIQHNEGATGAELERELFILRKLIESEKVKRISAQTADAETVHQAEGGPDAADFYICSMSNNNIVYKVTCCTQNLLVLDLAPCSSELQGPAALHDMTGSASQASTWQD